MGNSRKIKKYKKLLAETKKEGQEAIDTNVDLELMVSATGVANKLKRHELYWDCFLSIVSFFFFVSALSLKDVGLVTWAIIFYGVPVFISGYYLVCIQRSFIDEKNDIVNYQIAYKKKYNREISMEDASQKVKKLMKFFNSLITVEVILVCTMFVSLFLVLTKSPWLVFEIELIIPWILVTMSVGIKIKKYDKNNLFVF